jgi:flagellar protein FlaJ
MNKLFEKIKNNEQTKNYKDRNTKNFPENSVSSIKKPLKIKKQNKQPKKDKNIKNPQNSLSNRIKKLFKTKKYSEQRSYGKDRNLNILLAISLSISILFFILGAIKLLGITSVFNEILTGMDLIVFGLLCIIGPIGFYTHIKIKNKREIENHLPDFLRAISSSTSSGMTVYDAIKSSSEGDYGNLGPELKKMTAQLSWGIPVKEALDNFAKRINTPAVKRIVVTINKALEMGGNSAMVFDAAAKEIDQTKLVEQQRKAEMSLYSIVIFVSFFVFLAVIVIINSTIIAEFVRLQGKLPSGNIGGLSMGKIDPSAIKNAFYTFVLVQSIGGGLLGGFMMDGKLSSGVRFGFVLILITFFVFKFMF